ncbi:MAG: hypothetical protein F4Y57_04340, partial [Acidobacteria bacterium]|nr:hypothetical protein [Acidobacteriota bacterium]
LLGGGATGAGRGPAQGVARARGGALGHPVPATRANRSGAPPATTAAAAVEAVGRDLACVLDAGPAEVTTPSTIVDARGPAPMLLRPGAVAWDRVLNSLG